MEVERHCLLTTLQTGVDSYLLFRVAKKSSLGPQKMSARKWNDSGAKEIRDWLSVGSTLTSGIRISNTLETGYKNTFYPRGKYPVYSYMWSIQWTNCMIWFLGRLFLYPVFLYTVSSVLLFPWDLRIWIITLSYYGSDHEDSRPMDNIIWESAHL